jgi:hypothetical protein
MTVTYSLSTDVGKVRLKIGDTDTTDYHFTDEEIEVFLDNNSDNINLASAEALEAWANAYAANPSSENIGGYSYSQKVVDNMLKTAQRLRDQDAEVPAMDIASIDLTAGSAITEEED